MTGFHPKDQIQTNPLEIGPIGKNFQPFELTHSKAFGGFDVGLNHAENYSKIPWATAKRLADGAFQPTQPIVIRNAARFRSSSSRLPQRIKSNSMRQLLPISCLLLFTGCTGFNASFSRTTTGSYPADNVKSVDLSTFNGSVEVTSNNTGTIEVEAKCSALAETGEEAKANCELLSYETNSVDSEFSVLAVRPETLKNVSVSLKVSIPQECHLKIKTSNGSITVTDRVGDVEIMTSNGQVTSASVIGALDIQTSNGSINVTDADGPVDATSSNGTISYSGQMFGTANRLHTSNGTINAALPTTAATHFNASTSNGKINCLIEPMEKIAEGKHNLEAIVGSQGSAEPAMVKLKTSNGTINVTKVDQVGATTESAQ